MEKIELKAPSLKGEIVIGRGAEIRKLHRLCEQLLAVFHNTLKKSGLL